MVFGAFSFFAVSFLFTNDLCLNEYFSQNEVAQLIRVYLCGDVFLEVLRYGNRRQLIKLERVGRRILRIAERFLVKSLFIRLNPEIHDWNSLLWR